MRKMASLPKGATRILKQWLLDHYNDPYPNGEEKIALAKFSGLTSNQVKTWFANARRRIHKGESIQSPKSSLNAFDPKDTSTLKNHLMIRNGLTESFSDIGFSSDPNSLVTPYFSQRVDLFGNGSGYDRMSGHSHRCIHSMYNPHACFSCKDVFDDGGNCTMDFAANDPRCFQHNMNIATPLPVHPNPACSFTRWSHRSPFQCRQQDEFDAWYRSISYQTEMHAHVPTFGIESQCERPCVMESNGQTLGLDPCLQGSSGLQEKSDNIHMDASKDSLTEVGAARILADLSSKQNLSTQLGQADSILAHATV